MRRQNAKKVIENKIKWHKIKFQKGYEILENVNDNQLAQLTLRNQKSLNNQRRIIFQN